MWHVTRLSKLLAFLALIIFDEEYISLGYDETSHGVFIFLRPSITSFLLVPNTNIFFSTLHTQTISLWPSLSVTAQVSRSHTRTGKPVFLFYLHFYVSGSKQEGKNYGLFSTWTTKCTQYGTIQYKSQNEIRFKYKCYMFRHWSAIFRMSNKTKNHKYLDWRVGLVSLCFTRLPKDGAPLPKHVCVVLTLNCILLYFIIFILFYFILYCILLYLIKCTWWLHGI